MGKKEEWIKAAERKINVQKARLEKAKSELDESFKTYIASIDPLFDKSGNILSKEKIPVKRGLSKLGKLTIDLDYEIRKIMESV